MKWRVLIRYNTGLRIKRTIITAVALQWIRFGWGTFLKTQLSRWTLLAAVFGLACVAVNQWLPQGTWLWFAAKVALAVMIYAPLAWFILLPRDERARWGPAIRNRLLRR